MFDVGFTEVMLIAAVALLVVGPEKLPKLARTAGLWVGRARRMVADVKSDIDREIKRAELGDDIKNIKKSVDSVKSDITSAASEVGKSIQSGADEIKSDVNAIKQDMSLNSNATEASSTPSTAKPTVSATPSVPAKPPAPGDQSISGTED
jgi:sec-independent protein translocase protein TatB